MGKDNKGPAMSNISGSSFPSFIKQFSEGQTDSKYIGRALLAGLVSFTGEPFRWYEELRYSGKVDRFEVKQDPVFILGHWRSGTTFLHNLMCEDPAYGFVTTYHGVFPNYLLGSKWLYKNMMRNMMPEKRASDNMALSPDFPQEEEFAIGCRNAMSYYNFWFFPKLAGLYFDKYIDFKGVSEKVKQQWKDDYMILVKKALMNTGGERFISKNPPHTARIPMLLEMFPNAKFIHIYRNPITVFESTKKLITSTIPPLKFHDYSEQETEATVFDIYPKLMKKYIRDKELVPEGNLVELRFEEFEKDPVMHLGKIYEQLNIPNWEEAKVHFDNYVQVQKRYKKNKYQITRKKVDEIISHWQFAMDHWQYGIPEHMEVID